jgi:oxygen-dependent protoporphyrinogen oxidase
MGSPGTFDVVVAGGGLSGLATAEAILRIAPGLRLLCLEADARTGGVIRTIRDQDFLVETGPAGFLDKCGAVVRLAEALGLAGDLITSNDDERVRWIMRGGRLRRFPSSVREFLTSDLLSARGKLRMLTEPWRATADGDETVASFATRRLGREAAELLVDPIVSGIYAADASQVSLQASLPHLAGLERKHKSLLVAFLRASGTVRPLLSFRGGCEQLVDAVRDRLRDRTQCGSPVDSVAVAPNTEGDGFVVRVGGVEPRQLRARAVASAAPAHAASQYLRTVDPELAWQLAQVRYASVAVVALGYRRHDVPHPLAGFGYLVPQRERSPILGVQWSSSIYPGARAPDGTCLLRLFLGGAPNPTLAHESEEHLAELARAEVARAFRVSARPIVCHVQRHFEAMPQYLVEHTARVAEIGRRAAAHPGLFVGGNGLRGLGMDAVVRDAELQAHAVVEYLRTSNAMASATAAPDQPATNRPATNQQEGML